jgi:hypothetical protein
VVIMTPAEQFEAALLVGKRVAFKRGEDHEGCWHRRVGLVRGVVVKLGQSLAQKAELVGANEELPEGWFTEYEDVPRLWVKAEPCASFPRGCEAAVEQECLLVLDPGEE